MSDLKPLPEKVYDRDGDRWDLRDGRYWSFGLGSMLLLDLHDDLGPLTLSLPEPIDPLDYEGALG